MSTDNGVPRVGDTIEFMPQQLAKAVRVQWNLYPARDPEPYKEGYITHQAVVTLVAAKRAKRR
jgi:hypothetical protein